MKSSDSKKTKAKTKTSAGYLEARAVEADKQAEAARKVARLAKSRFKEARKAFKQAKKFAKQARKEAKLAAKALKERTKKAHKTPKKKAAARKSGKTAAHHVSVIPRTKRQTPVKTPKSPTPPAAQVRDGVPAVPDAGSHIAKT
jgi:hypothetical protein